MSYEGLDRLVASLDGNVLRVTLNWPEKRNVVGAATSRDLGRVFHDAAADDAVRAIVLTGAGSVFCAGGDIVAMQDKIDDPAKFYAGIINSRRLVFSMLDCAKPIVCRVNGDAIGLGATLALLCDIVVAGEGVKIGDPHVRMGLVAGDGGALLWPQFIGYARARQYLLSGDLLTGREAERIGLINFAAPLAEVDAIVEHWADRLARGASQSIAGTKALINLPLRQAAQAMLDMGMAYEGLSNISRDHQEAVTAFIEKRKPDFTGK